MNHKVYLAGPIHGLTFDGAQSWRDEFRKRIDQRIQCYSPLRGKEYLTMRGKLEGSYDEFPLSSDRGLTERDRFDCTGSDLVVCNLLGATERVSIGTMIELGWADANRVPVVLIMEKTGNVHDHPMVRQTTSWRIDNIDDALKITEIILLANRDANVTGERRISTLADRRQIYNPARTFNSESTPGGRRMTFTGRRKTDTARYNYLPIA